ncbi:helix-turn-helix domain-containing protein [Capnocytophaga leadbetteri]|uniref:helix-turn-helix domain-containing protein n=1 Tax=Capnocytophaga leadbetteri TaxID=327575 RepID=UPI0028E72533|nr:helix-turn-helix domain-containing protein [Capnocytophaga leadbetteri]
MSSLFVIGIFLCCFLSVLLFSKAAKRLPDNILGVWLLCIATYLLNYYLHYLGYWEKYPHLVGATHPFPLLFAPFVYLYVVTNLRQPQRLYWRDGLHFLPFVVIYVLMFPFLFGYSAAEKAMIDQADYHSPYQWLFTISFIAFVIVCVAYSVATYHKINQYEQIIGEQFAYNEGISLQWLRLLLIGFGIIFSVMIVGYVLQFLLEIELAVNVELIFLGLFVLLIALIGFWGIRYQGIFTAEKPKVLYSSEKPEEAEETEESLKMPEYRKSGLKPEEAKNLHQQLLTLMATEKPYLEPKLSLAQLADSLGVLPNHLSQIINQYEGKNFYDFVNNYRVDEFIALAKKDTDKNFNLLGLAFEAGFNSKSSFNQVFKKIKGKTPSQFVNESIN